MLVLIWRELIFVTIQFNPIPTPLARDFPIFMSTYEILRDVEITVKLIVVRVSHQTLTLTQVVL